MNTGGQAQIFYAGRIYKEETQDSMGKIRKRGQGINDLGCGEL